MKSHTIRATNLTGTNVQNLQGENIGKIQDLMIDTETGRVVYSVLSFGGFMGLGDEYFAIPIEALVFSNKDKNLIKLDIDKETLENAPGFDKDNWPMEANDEYVHSVYDHYGYDYKPRTQV